MTHTAITKSETIEGLREIRDRIVDLEQSVKEGEELVEILHRLIGSRRTVGQLMRRVFVVYIADEVKRYLDTPASTLTGSIDSLKWWRRPFP